MKTKTIDTEDRSGTSLTGYVINDPNVELDAEKSMSKYQTSITNQLYIEALERIVNKFNCGCISAKVADKKIKAIKDIRMKYLDIKSVRYVPMSTDKLEMLYCAYS